MGLFQTYLRILGYFHKGIRYAVVILIYNSKTYFYGAFSQMNKKLQKLVLEVAKLK